MGEKIVTGRLSENLDVVRRAMERAARANELVPVKRQISPGRWVFRMVKESSTTGSRNTDPSKIGPSNTDPTNTDPSHSRPSHNLPRTER